MDREGLLTALHRIANDADNIRLDEYSLVGEITNNIDIDTMIGDAVSSALRSYDLGGTEIVDQVQELERELENLEVGGSDIPNQVEGVVSDTRYGVAPHDAEPSLRFTVTVLTEDGRNYFLAIVMYNNEHLRSWLSTQRISNVVSLNNTVLTLNRHEVTGQYFPADFSVPAIQQERAPTPTGE